MHRRNFSVVLTTAIVISQCVEIWVVREKYYNFSTESPSIFISRLPWWIPMGPLEIARAIGNPNFITRQIYTVSWSFTDNGHLIPILAAKEFIYTFCVFGVSQSGNVGEPVISLLMTPEIRFEFWSLFPRSSIPESMFPSINQTQSYNGKSVKIKRFLVLRECFRLHKNAS